MVMYLEVLMQYYLIESNITILIIFKKMHLIY